MTSYYTHVLDTRPSHTFEQRRIYKADEVDEFIKRLLQSVTPETRKSEWKRFKALASGQ